METLPINLEEGLSSFSWQNGSLLSNVTFDTPCKEIFQAVCDEIGRFYQTKGFKYSTSGRKLEYQYKGFKLKISFASSHYNSVGQSVGFEVNSGLYPDKLQKQYKADKHRLLPIILSNVDLLDEIMPDREPGTVQGVSMFGEVNEVRDELYKYALRIYSRYRNVYGITIENFKKLLEYLNLIITYSFSLVLNPQVLVDYINKTHERKFYWLKEERFLDYLRLYHSQDSEVYQAFLRKYKEFEGKEFAPVNYAQQSSLALVGRTC